MKENTNRAIALNSIILYIRLIINLVCSLFATRFSLAALGVSDYGLYAVLGGIISFMSILNTIMVATTNRYISVAIGKGDVIEIREQFNVNLFIHIFIALITLVIMIPLGEWYVYHYVNYDGNMDVASKVLLISLVGSVVSFISVPYNGLMMAKENFITFCSVDVIAHILKLLVAYLLIDNFENKLLIYAGSLAFLTALPTLIYYVYCNVKYREITQFTLVKDIDKYKDVLSFSVWVGYGAIASVAKTQGAAVIVNMFFNTIMNTALSVANTVNSLISLLSQNVSQPIAPQLMKAYAAGNSSRCDELLVLSTKFTYLISFLVAMPLLLETEWVIKIWLGEVPAYSVVFCRLLIIDTLVTALNSGISNVIFASGKIRAYQIIINTLRLLSLVAAYFALKYGLPPQSLLIVYIAFSVIVFFSTQLVLHKTLNYDNMILWKHSYFPSFIVTIVSLSLSLFDVNCHPFINLLIYAFSVLLIILLLGFSSDERRQLFSWLKNLIK